MHRRDFCDTDSQAPACIHLMPPRYVAVDDERLRSTAPRVPRMPRSERHYALAAGHRDDERFGPQPDTVPAGRWSDDDGPEGDSDPLRAARGVCAWAIVSALCWAAVAAALVWLVVA